MPKVKAVEKRIWDVEGFDIRFQQNGRSVHSKRPNIPQYSYINAAKNSMTINDWKEIRFKQKYPGYDVVVFDGNGEEITAGQMQLGNLRDSYSEDNDE